jgi:signal transduction histidine kinase/ActR/RegA family two-component response regulator
MATALAYFASYQSIRQSNASTAGVNHTQRTLAALIALEGSLADLVFAAHEPALSRASTEAFNRLGQLSAQTADSEAQQGRVARARREVEDLLRVRQDNADSATRVQAEALVRQNLSRTVRELRAEELRLLTERVAMAQATSRQLTSTLFVLGAGSAVLLAWVLGLAIRHERSRQENETMLRTANQDLDARVAARTVELHDVLERERALRSEAESSNRLKDEFLMTVSHELRTPLNALLGWAGILRTAASPEDLRRRAAAAIHESAKLQAQLIEDLLDTARILTAKLRIEPTLIDVGRIVEDAVSVVAPAAEAKELALDVHIDHPGVILFGDPMRIRQIVWNLVSNAVKFTKEGRVSVRVLQESMDGEVKIVVADTGIGIAPEFLPHVFERFRQERVGTTRSHRGLGLGLAIVQELVELHGGAVGVESDGAGRGATFTVSLPTKSLLRRFRDGAAKESADAQPADRTAMPALDGTRVLVVDDDPAVRDVVTATLEYCGARVTPAQSAADARKALECEACDVLLVDIAMPDEDGYTLVRTLRAKGLSQPVAAFTAHANASDRRLASEAGFDVHIAKPIEAASLARAVATLAGSRRVGAS